jgi:hypothetical protein
LIPAERDAEANALARRGPGHRACDAESVAFGPIDLGIINHLTFSASGRAFPVVTISATGLQDVHGLGPTRSATGASGFWRTLGAAIGLPYLGYASFRGRGPG